VYISDRWGFHFGLALNNVNSLNNWWDFQSIYNLDGVYIANTLLAWEDGSYVNPGGQVMLKTQITYDNGNTWRGLRAPAQDSSGIPITCGGMCSLNFFGRTTWLGVGNQGFFSDIYTQREAVGLIVATGNWGPYLSFARSIMGTFLSRDGGVSWSEIVPISTVAAYGNHGGVLVLVPNQIETGHLYYSLDEGLTFAWFTFTNDTVIVNSLRSVSPLDQKFLIKASRNGQVIYYAIDFSNLQERTCNDADYETWTYNVGACVLGRKTLYNRRKQTSQCFNPTAKNPIAQVTDCICSPLDYECDANYMKLQNGQCVGTPPDPMLLCSEGQSHYWLTQGWRRIPGDSCVNGLPNYEPIMMECPKRPIPPANPEGQKPSHNGLGPGSTAAVLIFVIFVCILAAFWGGMAAAFKTPWVRKMVPRTWLPNREETNRLL